METEAVMIEPGQEEVLPDMNAESRTVQQTTAEDTEVEEDPVAKEEMSLTEAIAMVSAKCEGESELDSDLRYLCFGPVLSTAMGEIRNMDISTSKAATESVKDAEQMIRDIYERIPDRKLIEALVLKSHDYFAGNGAEDNPFNRPIELIDDITKVDIDDQRTDPPSEDDDGKMDGETIGTLVAMGLASLVGMFGAGFGDKIVSSLIVVITIIYFIYSSIVYEQFQTCGIDNNSDSMKIANIVVYSVIGAALVPALLPFGGSMLNVPIFVIMMAYLMFVFVETNFYKKCYKYEDSTKKDIRSNDERRGMIWFLITGVLILGIYTGWMGGKSTQGVNLPKQV